MLRDVAIFLACFVVARSVSDLYAANKTWTSAVGGDFTDAAKWTGGVPGAGDTATFNAAGTYTITFDNVPVALANPVLNQDLFVQAGNVTFTSGAGGPYTYRLTGAGGDDAVITGGSLALGTSGNPLHLTVDDDLRIRGNASLLARFGSDITTLDLLVGESTVPAGDGTLTIDGNGSLLTVNGSTQLGSGARTGTLTLKNGADATFIGTLNVANSNITGTSGVLNLESNANVTAGNISLATTGGSGTSATIDMHDAGITQTGASTLTVGHASTATANIHLRGFSTFRTGTGLFTINATGTVTINPVSVTEEPFLVANGDVTIDGGTLNVGGQDGFRLADGKTMNITGGGRFSTPEYHVTVTDATYNVSGADSQWDAGFWTEIMNGADVNVTAGGAFSTDLLDIAQDGHGTLIVDGTDSSVAAGNGRWGDGFSANVTFRNNASGTFDSLSLAQDPQAGTSASLQVESGADIVADNLSVATAGASAPTNFGLVDITGAGSSLTLNAGGMLTVGHSSTGNADIRVRSGGSLVVGAGGVTTLNAKGEIVINGGTADLQTLVHNGGKLDFVAGSLSYLGSLRVGVGGPLDTGGTPNLTFGTTRQLSVTKVSIDPGSTLTISGGTLNTDELNIAGTMLFSSGTVAVSDAVLVDTGSTLTISGGTLNTDELDIAGTMSFTSGTVEVSGAVSIDTGSTLTLNGGTLNTDRLDIRGTFIFNSGTLGVSSDDLVVIQPTGVLQASRTINGIINGVGITSVINVTTSGIVLGSVGSLFGFHHEGQLNVGANTVTLNSVGYARLGVLTTLNGGTINAPNGVVFAAGSNFQGHGTIAGRILGELGSVIDADGPLSLGNATHVAAFNFDGELRVNHRTVTLNSTSPVGLGNMTWMGVALSPGTLNATNGFVLDFDEAIVGYGTVHSTNTLAKRSIVNGTVFGNSAAFPITFTGYVKGVGTFNNVVFAGTFDPGLSPTIITAGNMSFASTNTLNIEIGGTARGSQYDAIVASGALGLDGALQVALINGFTPAAGNLFDILDWATLTGTFDTLQLPALSSGLTWDTSQLYTAGVLAVTSVGLPGDYNENGVVDAADFVLWRKNLGSGTSLANDGTAGVGPDDYNRWRANFGRTAGAGAIRSASASIPEPHSLVVVLAAAASLLTSLRPNRRAAKAECPHFICS